MHNLWSFVIIGIILFGYIVSNLISYLNLKALSPNLPEEVKDVYDSEKYSKSQNYTKTNTKFGFITGLFSIILILCMIFFDGFAFADSIASKINPQSQIITALFFFGILFFVSDILNIPFEIYDIFVIEKKFGFNKTTPKIFIGDKLKGYILSAILGGGILSLIIYLYTLFPIFFWIFAWITISIISIFIALFYSNLIVPLFNKQTPLEEGELKNAIEEFSKKAGFQLKNIYKIDGSKRSTKANAYFTGFGPKKRIVLYDTLIDQLTIEEIVAVLAHEIGHYKKKHTLTGIIVSIFSTGFTLFLFNLMVKYPQISEALGVEGIKFHIALIAFAILYSPISMISGLVMNIFSRKNEFAADNYAKNNGMGLHLISSLKKLSINNLSNLTPHWLNVFVNYSHPPLLKRIENLKN